MKSLVSTIVLLAMAIGAILAMNQWSGNPLKDAPRIVSGSQIKIIDGDTIRIGDERIRLLGIDAPETDKTRCPNEAIAGILATQELVALIGNNEIEIRAKGQDRYRRTLAKLYVNNRDIGAEMVKSGHALKWQRGPAAWEERFAHWCGLDAVIKWRAEN